MKIDTVIQIARHFGLSTDLLLTKEITVNELYRFDLMADKLQTVDQKKMAERSRDIPLVRADKFFEMIPNLKNKDFFDQLEKISLEDLPSGKYRAFEINNNEMLYHHSGIKPGDVVVGHQIGLSDINELKPGVVLVVISNQLIVRRLKEVSDELVLMADNPFLPVASIPLKSLAEIYLVDRLITSHIPGPVLLEERVMQIEVEMERMKEKLKKLE